MKDRSDNHGTPSGDNQRIGKELYNQDRNQNQQRNSYRGDSQRSWDEGNFFHTGPSSHGAQDRDQYNRNQSRGGNSGNSSYQQGQNQQQHYGNRPDSAYRNERNLLNHGDGIRHNQGYNTMKGNAGGSQPGNYNEPPERNSEIHREGPGSRSRYKEIDYRYGSGSHNWHRENRYTPNEDRDSNNNDRGFFDKVRDSWNDIMNSDDPDYQDRNTDRHQADELSSRKRYGSEPYQDRQYDNGYDRSRDRGVEGSGRWADETGSGDDDQYRNTDRNQRWRR